MLVKTQSFGNLVVSLQHYATNTQRCDDIDATTSKLQRCSIDILKLDSKLILQYTKGVIMTI